MANLLYSIYRDYYPLVQTDFTGTTTYYNPGLADSGTDTISVINSNTYSRAAGWDGFLVDKFLYTSGFTNSVNNDSRGLARVVSVSGTELVTNRVLTNETGTGNERVRTYPYQDSGGSPLPVQQPIKDPNWNSTLPTIEQRDATHIPGQPIAFGSRDYSLVVEAAGIKMDTWGTPGTDDRYMLWNLLDHATSGWVDITLAGSFSSGTAHIYLGSISENAAELLSADFSSPSYTNSYYINLNGTRPILHLRVSGDCDIVIENIVFRETQAEIITGNATDPISIAYSDTGLSNDTTYSYSARVTDQSGNVSWAFDSDTTSTATKVLAPTISPPSGTFIDEATIYVFTPTVTADDIYITLDGRTPSSGDYDEHISGYTGYFIIDTYGEYTIAAIAVESGKTDSDITTTAANAIVIEETTEPPISGDDVTVAYLDCPPPVFHIDCSINPSTGNKWIDESELGGTHISYEFLKVSKGRFQSASMSIDGDLNITCSLSYIGQIVPEVKISSDSGLIIDMLNDEFPDQYNYLRDAWRRTVLPPNKISRQ